MHTAYTIIVIVLCLLTLLLNLKEFENAKSLSSSNDRLYVLATQIVLFLGVLLRLVYLQYPYGINLDEAMSGYEAWCLANFGTDQYMQSYPVYLKSWGSGQNALYTYLSMPLVKLFGLSLPMHRLPVAILGSFTLFSIYYALKKSKSNQMFIFIFILFLAFNPWHFTKSRWGLESNLAPDIILIATCLILIGYNTLKANKRIFLYTIAFLLFGIAAYAYAVVWMMLPIYCLAILVFLYKKGKITIRQSLFCLGITFLIVFPLLLFLFQMLTGGDSIHVGIFTIPSLTEGRQEATSVFALKANKIGPYLYNTFKGLATGYDKLLTNSFPYAGQFYNPIGWFFILFAFISLYKKRETVTLVDSIFFIWLLVSIPISLYVQYNVNRWNILWYPLIYFCVRGIFICIDKYKIREIIFYVVFFFFTIYTAANYIQVHSKAYLFTNDIEKTVEITSRKTIDRVYILDIIPHSSILFYDPISPEELSHTRKLLFEKQVGLGLLSEFGKYKIDGRVSIEPTLGTAYIMPTKIFEGSTLDHSKFKIQKEGSLTVIWND